MLPSAFLVADAIARDLVAYLPYALPLALLAAGRIGWALRADRETRERIERRLAAIRA